MNIRAKRKAVAVGRINVRIDQAMKDRISKAAYIVGKDITEFTVSTLNEKADEIIERNEQFELNEAERKAFFEILDGPIPTPSEYSLRARDEYHRMIKDGKLIV